MRRILIAFVVLTASSLGAARAGMWNNDSASRSAQNNLRQEKNIQDELAKLARTSAQNQRQRSETAARAQRPTQWKRSATQGGSKAANGERSFRLPQTRWNARVEASSMRASVVSQSRASSIWKLKGTVPQNLGEVFAERPTQMHASRWKLDTSSPSQTNLAFATLGTPSHHLTPFQGFSGLH